MNKPTWPRAPDGSLAAESGRQEPKVVARLDSVGQDQATAAANDYEMAGVPPTRQERAQLRSYFTEPGAEVLYG